MHWGIEDQFNIESTFVYGWNKCYFSIIFFYIILSSLFKLIIVLYLDSVWVLFITLMYSYNNNSFYIIFLWQLPWRNLMRHLRSPFLSSWECSPCLCKDHSNPNTRPLLDKDIASKIFFYNAWIMEILTVYIREFVKITRLLSPSVSVPSPIPRH